MALSRRDLPGFGNDRLRALVEALYRVEREALIDTRQCIARESRRLAVGRRHAAVDADDASVRLDGILTVLGLDRHMSADNAGVCGVESEVLEDALVGLRLVE